MKRKPKRRPDGRWQRKSHGRVFISSISQEDADQQAQEYADMLKNGLPHDAGVITFGEYARKWLPINKTDCNDETYNSAASRIDKASSILGEKPIKDIVPSEIKNVYNIMITGKSKSYADKVSHLIRSIFDSAVEDGYCKKNPCRSKTAKVPVCRDRSHRPLEDWERKLIEESCKDNPVYPVAMLMLYTGLRPSEALAIDIDKDVDFEKKTITVHQVRRSNGNQTHLSNRGKTEKSVGRVLPLFSPLEEALKGRHGLVISYNNGHVLSLISWKSRWETYIRRLEEQINGHKRVQHHNNKSDPLYDKIRKLRKKGDFKQAESLRLEDWKTITIRPYDLRHEFCTWCCDNRVDMHTLIEWMGHVNFKMVQKIYDHVTEERVKKEIEKLESVIKSSQNGSQSA